MLLTRKNEMDMCTGPLFNKLVIYTLPVMLTGILQLLFNAADVVVVGRFAGSAALAAVGSTTPLINLLVNVFMMTSIGVSVEAAKNYGAHEPDAVSRTVSTAMAMSLIIGLFVCLFGVFACRPLLKLMDSPADVIDQSVLYLKIYFLGIPAFMVYNFGAAALRAVGDTRRPMIFLAISGVINVILNLITVIVFQMGVAGVAIATAVSQYVSATFIVLSLVRSDGCMHFDIGGMKLHRDKVIAILKVGLPAGMQSAVFSLSNVMIQSAVNSFGSAVMAGKAAANNISGFVYTSMNAVVQASMAFTGQNMGAKKYSRVNRILWECLLLVCILGGGLGALACIFRRTLVGIYVTDSPETLEVGMTCIMMISGPYFIMGIIDVFAGVMRGMGKSAVPMVISIFGICVFRVIWLYTVFSRHHTLTVLLLSYPVSWVVALIGQATCYAVLKKRMLDSFTAQTRL